MPLYHGGVAGLPVGGLILPPALTQAPCCAEYGAEGIHSRHHVYVTPSFELAFLYAALVSRHPGYVYEVLPVGVVEHDQDMSAGLPGRSFQCERALIVGIPYRCTTKDTAAAWRSVCAAPIGRFLASMLER